MLTLENHEPVSIASDSARPRRASVVSALDNFNILVAANPQTRELAFRLAYNVYVKKGYIIEGRIKLLSASHDARPDTVVALVLDHTKRPAGTVTLVFDANEGLPCDQIFHNELCALRDEGRWMIEVARLAIDDEHANCKELLALLCNVPFAFATHIRGYTAWDWARRRCARNP